jgi:hypothetical protein
MAVHHDVAASVDAILRGHPLTPEIRYRDEGGQVRIEAAPQPAITERRMAAMGAGRLPFEKRGNGRQGAQTRPGEARPVPGVQAQGGFANAPEPATACEAEEPAARPRDNGKALQPVRIYPFGVSRGRLQHAAENLGVPVVVVNVLEEAQAVLTLKNYYRKHPQPITEAERRRIPVYVLRANTINQMEASLGDMFGVPVEIEDPYERATAETQEAIRRVLSGSASEDLRPAAADVRRMQHDMARAANLVSHSYGSEPRRRVRIFQN